MKKRLYFQEPKIEHWDDLATNLEELRKEYDEEYWYVDDIGKINFSIEIIDKINGTPNNIIIHKEIGNYFNTREEAEKALKKLRAWKRLRDSGFRFIGKTREYNQDKHFGSVFFEISGDIIDTYGDVIYFNDDFDLLFGGEE